MIISDLNKFVNGWIIGDFEPSLLKTKDFEIGIKKHYRGEKIVPHFHKITTEYNVLISGKMIMNGELLLPNDVFVMEPGEMAYPSVIEDSIVVIARVPSIPNDKWME